MNNDIATISQITDQIYLSGISPLEKSPTLVGKLGIKYIVCCVEKNQVLNVYSKLILLNPGIIILYIPLEDMPQQNLWAANRDNINLISCQDLSPLLSLYQNKSMIEIAYHFIDHVINSKHKVLIHCMAGVSRSVSTLIYYMMKKYHLAFIDALQFIQSKRKIANPNDSFKLQLKVYQVKRDQFNEADAQKVIEQL